jgi:hypothetical protein
VVSARLRFSIAVLVCLAGAARAAEEPPAAPLVPAFGERSLHLLHTPILFFGPADPARIAPGRLRLSLEAAYANTFSETWHARRVHAERAGTPFTRAEADDLHARFGGDEITFVDGELLRTAVVGRVGLSPAFSVGVELPYLWRGAFSLDGAIEDFHRAFGFADVGRTEFPSGRFVVMLQSPGGAMRYDDHAPASGLGDVTTTLSYRPGREWRRWRFGADAAVKAPTGRAADFNGSGSWDGGLLAFAVRPGRTWTFSIEAAEVFPGRWKIRAVPLETAPFARLFASATRRLGSRTRVGASVTAEQSPFRRESLAGLSRAGVEFALGVERDFRRRWGARLTLTENLPSAGDRADLGLVLGFVRR